MYQCNRCLAPLRVYQGQPVRVCDRCGAIQPGGGAAPPPQQPGFGPQQPGFGPQQPGFGPQQPGFGSPVQVAMPPRARKGSPVGAIVAVVAVLGVLVAGLVTMVMVRQQALTDAGFAGGIDAPGQGAGNGEGGTAYWDDAPKVKAQIRSRLGAGARVTEVLLYRDYGFVEVLEGGSKVRYEMRGGGIKRADGFARPSIPGEKDEDAVLPFDDIDFAVVPAMVKLAREKVGPRPDEHVHVRLARHLPFIADPMWSVYLGSGNADFDLAGRLVGGRTAAGADLDKQVVNYFQDASPVRAALERRFGASVQLVELILYPTYAIGEVRDPQQPENVDRYTIRPGGMSPGDPMHNSSSGWDGKAFALTSIDFALVPRLSADAKGRLVGDVSHIFLEKGGFRVYVSDKRNSGYVSYRSDGTLIRVMK